MDQEFFTQLMVQFIKVNLKMINFMDMELLYKLLLFNQTWPDRKRSFEGYWKNGLKNGDGTMKWGDGKI